MLSGLTALTVSQTSCAPVSAQKDKCTIKVQAVAGKILRMYDCVGITGVVDAVIIDNSQYIAQGIGTSDVSAVYDPREGFTSKDLEDIGLSKRNIRPMSNYEAMAYQDYFQNLQKIAASENRVINLLKDQNK